MNVIARLEFELAFYDSAVHRFNHYTTRTRHHDDDDDDDDVPKEKKNENLNKKWTLPEKKPHESDDDANHN